MLAVVESLWVAGRSDSCWAILGCELRTARSSGDSAFVLDLLTLRGRARARLGLIKEAEPDLRAAVALADSLGQPRTMRANLRWLFYTFGRQGRNAEALVGWHRLLTLSQASGDSLHEAWARTGIGFLAWQGGDSREAEAQYRRALDLFHGLGDARDEAYVNNGLGTALQAQGTYEQAEAQYFKAAAGARASGWTWLEALALNNVASLRFSLGDPGQARDLYTKSAELHRQAGDLAEAAFTGQNIAHCDQALGLFEEAVTELQRIRDDCRAHGVVQLDGYLCNALAEVRFEQGRFRAAAALFRENLASGGTSPPTTRRESVLGLARVLARVDSLDGSLALLQRHSSLFRAGDPLDMVEYRLALGQALQQAGRLAEALPELIATEREAGRLGQRAARIQALAGAAQVAGRLGDPERSLFHARRALEVWESERGLPEDPVWREVRGAAAAEVVTGMGATLLEYPPHVPAAQRARIAFDAVQVLKSRTLMERMLGPAGAEAPALRLSPTSCADLQKTVLHPGELLLDFYLGAETSLLFAVSAEDCRAFRLPALSQLEPVLLPYLRMIAAPDAGGSAEAATREDLAGVHRRLRELLFGPVLDRVMRGGSLMVIPDGILHRLSFAALLSDPDTTGAGAVPVLQTVPSATILAQLRAESACRGAGTGSGAILALAGAEDGRGGPLREAVREVRDLAARFEGVQVSLPSSVAGASLALTSPLEGAPPADSSAESTILAALSRYDVLHLAAHATVEEEHAWSSCVHLNSDRAGGRVGGWAGGRPLDLTASAIARSRLSARLVVLSTCRSGGGRVLSGEGVPSLASAFLVAGVPAVIASLWPVDDRSTRLLMRRFYERLAGGATVAEALAQSQAAMRHDARMSAPFHWAGFVVVGDGELRVPLRRIPTTRRLALPAALVFLGALAVFGRRLRRSFRGLSSVIPPG